MTASPRYTSMERRAAGVPGEVLLNKLEEVNKSVKVGNFSFVEVESQTVVNY